MNNLQELIEIMNTFYRENKSKILPPEIMKEYYIHIFLTTFEISNEIMNISFIDIMCMDSKWQVGYSGTVNLDLDIDNKPNDDSSWRVEELLNEEIISSPIEIKKQELTNQINEKYTPMSIRDKEQIINMLSSAMEKMDFVKDSKKSVADIVSEIGKITGEAAQIIGFRRYYLGESNS